MSGPKVVRIVSPEEYARLEAQRDKLLSELKSAVERWHKCMKDLGFPTDDRGRNIEERIQHLRNTFFPEFSKSVQRVREQMKFLEADMQDARIQHRAAQKERRRNLESTARAISNELCHVNQKPSPDLLRVIERAHAATDAEFQSFQKIVNEAIPSLLKTSEKQVTTEQSTLAKELAADMAEIELIQNNVHKVGAETKNKNSRLDRLIAEIELMDDHADVAQFLVRSQDIAKEPVGQRKELLTDSLILDLSAHCKLQREIRDVAVLLKQVRASLLQPENELPGDLIREIDDAIAKPTSLKAAEALAEKVHNASMQQLSKSCSQAKRNAILKSFAELGYQVREGMDTMWAKNGKLVLSQKEKPSVGVELGSGDSLERLQMRAVAIAANGVRRDAGEDVKIETAWCGDLDKLRASLQAAGHVFVIELAQPIGKVPVKVCEPICWTGAESEEEEESRRSEKRLQAKSLE